MVLTEWKSASEQLAAAQLSLPFLYLNFKAAGLIIIPSNIRMMMSTTFTESHTRSSCWTRFLGRALPCCLTTCFMVEPIGELLV